MGLSMMNRTARRAEGLATHIRVVEGHVLDALATSETVEEEKETCVFRALAERLAAEEHIPLPWES